MPKRVCGLSSKARVQAACSKCAGAVGTGNDAATDCGYRLTAFGQLARGNRIDRKIAEQLDVRLRNGLVLAGGLDCPRQNPELLRCGV